MKLLVLCLLILKSSTSSIPELSSKTVYDAVRGDVRDVQTLSNNDGQCKPERLYFLLRHGSRNFGNTITTRINLFLKKFAELVNSGIVTLNSKMEWYKTWEGGIYYKDYELVVEGMYEHYSIASRYKEKFSSLFPNYSVYNYSLQATTKMRTIQSALSFMDGLLNGTGPLESSPDRLNIVMKGYMPPGMIIEKNDEDRLLRFVDCCPKYEKYINTLKWKEEANLFDQLPVYQAVVQSVSSVLNYKASLNDSKALYYLCAAENMSPTQAGHSQFCNVFNQESLDVLDFSKDLEKYYKYSYPYPTTYKMSCLLLNDIIAKMEGDNKTPVLKFAHEETVMPLLSLLGLFDDGEILTHKMEDWKNRKMKVSRITPFAGNVAFVRHSCPGDKDPRIQVTLLNKLKAIFCKCVITDTEFRLRN